MKGIKDIERDPSWDKGTVIAFSPKTGKVMAVGQSVPEVRKMTPGKNYPIHKYETFIKDE